MNVRSPSRRMLALAATLVLVSLMLAACGGSAASQPKITLKLAENAWTGSSINVNVAKILLEEKLGYKVELVKLDENAQWPALSNGDLSASLEVWPSGHADNMKQYIDEKKVVENLGPLGVVGKISWYVPTYVVQDHPELATIDGFKKPEDVALFKTAESGDKGQFLAGDPSWVQYDEDIIKNLGLDLKVVRAGSEQAVLAALDAAYSRKQPILFYFWTPHSIHAKYELTPVKLPEYTDACYSKAKDGGVACDYPKDVLFKIAWNGLKDRAPDAYQFLKNMQYSDKDQIGMIAAVELDKKTAEQAARDWVTKNEAVWKAWLPPGK
ncbi:MAG TPA: ABC transporter substrate-binding protein [Kouleothrix sp.]|nr:ABC transporter substrate-binding protein [Kouleothrix sp.]HRC76235.1 ABC transporter substrate-binding protein [Kouleothrix sp.]